VAFRHEWMAECSIVYKGERIQRRDKIDSQSVWLSKLSANDMSNGGSYLKKKKPCTENERIMSHSTISTVISKYFRNILEWYCFCLIKLNVPIHLFNFEVPSKRNARCSGKSLSRPQTDGCGLANKWCRISCGMNGNREALWLYHCHCQTSQTYFNKSLTGLISCNIGCPSNQYGASERCLETNKQKNLTNCSSAPQKNSKEKTWRHVFNFNQAFCCFCYRQLWKVGVLLGEKYVGINRWGSAFMPHKTDCHATTISFQHMAKDK